MMTNQLPSQVTERPPAPTPTHPPPFRAAPEPQSHEFYLNDPIFQRLQYEIRAAYEEGWSDGGGDPIRSPSEQEPVGWRKAWMKSSARKFLVANGINTGAVRWK